MMMTKLLALLLLITSLPAFAQDQSKRLAELEERLFDLELNMLNKSSLSVGGSFSSIYQYSSIRSDNGNIKKGTKDVITSDLKLNVNKVDDDTLKFYSTIGAKYFWNNNFQSPLDVTDNGQTEVRGSYPYVQKAYFDYFTMNNNLVFSAGRLPTVDGPPIEQSLGQSRMGTYPLLLYSVPLDGVAFTFNLQNTFDLKRRYIMRLIYSPFYSSDSRSDFTTVGNENNTHTLETKKGDALHANFETSGAIENLFNYGLIFQAYYVRFGRMQAIENVRGVADATCRAGGSGGVLCNATAGPDRNTYEVSSSDEYLADQTAISLHLDLEKVLNSKFDGYFTFKKTFFKKRGSLSAYLTEQNNGGAAPVGTTIAAGGFIYNSDQEGTEILLGAKYNLTNRHRVGVEYLRRTFGSAPGTIQTSGITDFYSIIGSGYHSYFNFDLRSNLAVTTGAMYLANEAEFVSFSYAERPSRVTSGYMNILLSF
tara:strand:- start:29122 stop:30561 length:1440 start_codon:yes stop_codon:yes gene_type:complete